MVSSVSSATTSSTASTAYDPVKAADKVLESLMKSSQMLESLVSQSSTWVPPSTKKMMATLWGLFNTSGSHSINKTDVQQAVFSVGTGSSSDIDALWAQLDPNDNGVVSPGDFALSDYLSKSIGNMAESVQSEVADTRLAQAAASPKGGSLLDFSAPSGRSGTMLDLFA